MQPMRCATHPDVETALTCGKCGKPICPRCLIQTPVGARCRECANPKPIPTFQVSAKHYLIAMMIGVALSPIPTLGMLFLRWLPIPFFYPLLIIGTGYLIGEMSSLSVNRKRGRGLQFIAGGCVFLSYALSSAIFYSADFYALIAFIFALFLAISRFR
ncbi:MAG: hypothetical protein HYX82_03025 [Chloroflexi bacterium]|nr:hypothetical protein [Chloroflexota bacterium]